ncbi:MAG: NAD(P)-binding domain-containing protein [Sporomusaceae bacterium]|nr:NAD(P)-binding domain-containing protein [Sporomusaceae bacterium]
MRISIVGIGRMGRVLAARLAETAELTLYDADTERAAEVAAVVGARAAVSLEDAAQAEAVILALPDQEVIACLSKLNLVPRTSLTVINIATNLARTTFAAAAAPHIRCVSAKFVGHAAEMAAGARPVIIVDNADPELTELAATLFAGVGDVLTGDSDWVAAINTIAAEKALEAAVLIEERLRYRGFADPAIAKSAIGQVAAGIIKAYAVDDLGPFARKVVNSVREKLAGR